MSTMFLSFVLLTMMISSHQVIASGSCENRCNCSTVQDVVFVIDTSGSIGSAHFQLIRNFTANITMELINRFHSSAVGVILFNNNAHIEFNLTAHTNLSSLLSAINELPYNGGGTDTAEALSLLLKSAQNGGLGLRNNSLNSAIVITDGESNDQSATESAANALHASNIFDVYSIGVGGADNTELNRIASSPEFVFFTSSFNSDGLQQLNEELLPYLCKDVRTVSLSQPHYTITENSGFLPVTITLNSTVSEDVIVEVTISDGSANAGVDYNISIAQIFNVTISAGSTSSSFSIDIINDMIQEDSETVNIEIGILSNCLSLSLGTSSSTVTIIDDEVAVINFTSPTFSGSESDEVASVQVMILGGIVSSRDIHVVITLTSITATGNDVDFNSTMHTVTIAAGSNSTTVNIPVIDDDIAEGNEMFNITLSLPSSLNGAGVRLTSDNDIVSATGIIIDTTNITIDSILCDNVYEQFQVSNETGCTPYEYDNLTVVIEQVCETTTLNDLIAALELLTAELVLFTNERDDNSSACPADLIRIVLLLEFIVNITESYPPVLSSRDIIEDTTDVFSNILSPLNNPGWIELQMNETAHSQDVLILSESFGILLAANLDIDGSVESDNIEIATALVSASSREDISLFNSTIENSILIPEILIRERSLITDIDPIPIATIQYENLHNILPITSNGANRIQPISQMLSSQVTNISGTSCCAVVQLTLHYSLENVNALSEPRCGFWNFSLFEGRGGWDITGVTTVSYDMNSSTIICNSNHLTSFAVLVDVSGSQQDRSDEENQALSIVSYIGCGISLLCLLIAIILLVYYRRTIFKEMQNYIHLNLAIALSLALMVFVSGIQTATENDIACTVVAALLHYFFTAVFAWMLCEGILLYLLLVKVFNIGLGQKKWLYLALGWGIPVPIVAISVGIAHDHYGNDDFCWIGTDEGAIWGFVAPMIAIIIVNVIFLVLALHSLYKSETRRMTTEEVTHAQTIRTLLKISVILLPLLGITWVFGILAVNQESSVFAWIFTVLNSLQGMFILVFQVLRNEKLRQKFTSCCKRDKYDVSSNSSKEKHIPQTRTKTSATTLSGFNTVDKITNEEGLRDSVFRDVSTAENGLKLTSLEVVKDQNTSSNSSEMYNKEGSVTSLQVSTAK